MSSTRHVQPGARRAQNGWASAVEFEELRGLNGNAVAFKAALLDDPRKRELLYFLQALSLREGGCRRIARELIETFPDRIGTPTMLKIGCKPGKRLTQAERDAIDEELNFSDTTWALLHREGDPDREHCKTTADEFCHECRDRAENQLDQFLERLCCDPKLAVTDDCKDESRYGNIVRLVLEDAGREEEARGSFELARLCFFGDVLGSLFEFQARCQKDARENFVETSIGKVVFEALDYAMETGRSALIEGNSGIGKTTALEAWCKIHAGRARLVRLKGITNRTGFFHEVARALGVAQGTGNSPAKVQIRVEQFLHRTKMMLAIDEGQYLFPAGNRIYSPPELINWLMTACYNEGVPFVISATAEFKERRAVAEKTTTWDSFQLRRRIRRFFALPALPTKDDLRRVAVKLLPDMAGAAIDYVVGYSLASKGFFQAITNAIEDAQLIARRAGRAEIKFADLKAAIQDWRSPSDAALQRVFDNKPAERGRRRTVLRAPESTLTPRLNGLEIAPPLPAPDLAEAEAPEMAAVDRRRLSPAGDGRRMEFATVPQLQAD
jgi:energy-coupling factor transporter ATP-binding protein EcfA2